MTESAGMEVGVIAGLTASLGQVAEELRVSRQRQDRLAQLIFPFTIPPQAIALAAGAGTLTVPNLLGPVTGQFWDVRRISVTGYTAGTVTVYQSQVGAEEVAVFSTAGVLLNGKAQIMLRGGESLCFSAASITGSVTVSVAGIQVAAPCIGDYLL